MIRIVCSSCQKPISLDENKLPMREVTFPCPSCATTLTVDRRVLPVESAEQSPLEADGFGTRALITGVDHPALHQAAKSVGLSPVFAAAPNEAREYFLREYPPVVMLHPQQLTAPPLESMQPVIALSPADRRRGFIILVAEGIRTLDGNAAFLYGVNLVVAPKDLGAFPQIYREAYTYHERLYASMNSALRVMTAIS